MGSRPEAEDDAAYESALALSRWVLRAVTVGLVLLAVLLAAWFLLVPWPEAHEVSYPSRTVNAPTVLNAPAKAAVGDLA